MRHLLLLAVAAGCGLISPSAADAYWWQGAGIGIGGLYRSLDYPTERRVPYFAAHPPVYYSTPVPRTYGYSPFAYTPDTRTPEIVGSCAEPVTIVNPYVPSSASDAAPARDESASVKSKTISTGSGVKVKPVGPLTIENPFVVPARSRTI